MRNGSWSDYWVKMEVRDKVKEACDKEVRKNVP